MAWSLTQLDNPTGSREFAEKDVQGVVGDTVSHPPLVESACGARGNLSGTGTPTGGVNPAKLGGKAHV